MTNVEILMLCFQNAGRPVGRSRALLAGPLNNAPCVSEYAGAGLGTSRPVTRHIPLPTVGSQALN